ncbi:MAG: hypothetical protein OEV92_09735 [Nitrospinota bacterium]|nr:hypothetical protein [Nitrospinota bacterium]
MDEPVIKYCVFPPEKQQSPPGGLPGLAPNDKTPGLEMMSNQA